MTLVYKVSVVNVDPQLVLDVTVC